MNGFCIEYISKLLIPVSVLPDHVVNGFCIEYIFKLLIPVSVLSDHVVNGFCIQYISKLLIPVSVLPDHVVNGFCIEYISKLLIPVSVLPDHAVLQSSTSGTFDVPRTRTECRKRAWNCLPPLLRQITDTGQFKRALNMLLDHLYSVPYNI